MFCGNNNVVLNLRKQNRNLRNVYGTNTEHMPKKLFEKGNPGKPKGAVNKNSKLIKEIFADAFYALQDDPDKNLVAWAKDNQTDFFKLAIRLIPTQINLTANIALTDEPIEFE